MTFSDVPPEPWISKIRSFQFKIPDPMIELVCPWPMIVNVLTGQGRSVVDDQFSERTASERRYVEAERMMVLNGVSYCYRPALMAARRLASVGTG